MPTLFNGPGCNLGNGRGCPLVVHYWADLQSVYGLRCYGNITQTLVTYKLASTPRYDDIVRTRNVSECSVLALCLVVKNGSYKTRRVFAVWAYKRDEPVMAKMFLTSETFRVRIKKFL